MAPLWLVGREAAWHIAHGIASLPPSSHRPPHRAMSMNTSPARDWTGILALGRRLGGSSFALDFQRLGVYTKKKPKARRLMDLGSHPGMIRGILARRRTGEVDMDSFTTDTSFMLR